MNGRPKRFRLARRPAVPGGFMVALAAALACRPQPPLLPATAADGQWVWSIADAALWRRAQLDRPALLPGVWVSTVWWEGGAAGEVVQRLALSPHMVAAPGGGRVPMAVVVRVDDRINAAWLAAGDGAAGDSAIAAQLDGRLAALLRRVDATGADVREVQLDYDCPVRRLGRWAAVVRRLRAGALAGREVWLTSLVAHVAQSDYGRQFRGVVSGHIVQVFDTGDEPSAAAAARLRTQLERVGLPFRLGVGAFERVVPVGDGRARLTNHRGWFALAPGLARSPLYRGLWVFPGGQPWTSLVASPVR